MKLLKLLVVAVIVFSCSITKRISYAEVVTPISKKARVIELLSDNGKGRIAIAPEIQGKVLTTTCTGLNGYSNGWINMSAINGNYLNIAEIGGEERLWFGPLGSQHSFYFQQKEPLNEDNWKVPLSLSSEGYTLRKFSTKEVLLSKQFKLTNFIGTEFNFEALRKIKLLEKKDIKDYLNISINAKIDFVAYESVNSIQNKDADQWKKETGLVSIWNSGMFTGTDQTVVIIPLTKESSLGAIPQYMGALDENKLQLKGRTLLFKADGKYRSKIGVPYTIAPDIYGCYSKDLNKLTIIQYRKTTEKNYTNSEVTIQKNPYQGEIIPIYNNGNMDYSETKENSFFELESTSASVALLPEKYVRHFHRVYHFIGDKKELNKISEQLLGVQLKDCTF